ncbi:hypothetical protein AB4K20DRAFT_1683267 [Rhizopus microsporus]
MNKNYKKLKKSKKMNLTMTKKKREIEHDSNEKEEDQFIATAQGLGAALNLPYVIGYK